MLIGYVVINGMTVGVTSDLLVEGISERAEFMHKYKSFKDEMVNNLLINILS